VTNCYDELLLQTAIANSFGETALLRVRVRVTLRLTISQSVSLGVEPHLGFMTRYLLLCDCYGLVSWGALSDERTGLSIVYAVGLCQRSLSRVRVACDSSPYFTVSNLRLPFRRLVRLAGSRWRYSTPPPHGSLLFCTAVTSYITATPTTQKTSSAPLLSPVY
jgi:hypothetical protein